MVEREEEFGEEEEREVTREEMIKRLIKLKTGKAPGENGLENEVWKHMPKSIGEALEDDKQDMERRRDSTRIEERGYMLYF